MRNLLARDVNCFRDTSGPIIAHYGNIGDATCGAFFVPSPVDGKDMRVIASSADGWDHVSVSRMTRCPYWPEMEAVRKLFLGANVAAMQLHLPDSEHINYHPYCLHIWRPMDGDIPRPPEWMVGPVANGGA